MLACLSVEARSFASAILPRQPDSIPAGGGIASPRDDPRGRGLLSRLLPSVLLLLGAFTCVEAQQEAKRARPFVEIDAVEVLAETVTASYHFGNTLSADVLARIQEGEQVRFRHRVELVRPKRWWLGRPRTLTACLIETAVTFDPLTESYALERTTRWKERRRDDLPEPRTETMQTDSFDVMREWMTVFQGVDLTPAAERPPTTIELRVDATFGRRFVAWLFPRPISAQDAEPLP